MLLEISVDRVQGLSMGLGRRGQMRSHTMNAVPVTFRTASGRAAIEETGETEGENWFTTQGVTKLVIISVDTNSWHSVESETSNLRDHRGSCARFLAGCNSSVFDACEFKRECPTGAGSKEPRLVCQRFSSNLVQR
jgi:hypothetical protein